MLFHVHLQHKQLLKLSFINLGADDTKTACIFRLTFTDLVFFRNHIEVYPCTVLAWQHTLCTKDNTVFIVVSGKRLQNCLHFFLCILTRCLFAPACEDFICVMVVMVIMIVVMTASAMIVMFMVVMMFMLMIVVIVIIMMVMLMIVVMMVFMFMIMVIVVMMVFMFMLMIVIIMVVIMVAAAYRTDFFFSHHHISQRHRFLHSR